MEKTHGREDTGNNDNGENIGNVEHDPEEILTLQLFPGENARKNQSRSHGEHRDHDDQQQHVLHGPDKGGILHQHLEVLQANEHLIGVEGTALIQRKTEHVESRRHHENGKQNHGRCHAREDEARALEIAFHL